MTKFESKRKELEIIEAMYEAVQSRKKWDCMNYNNDTNEYEPDENADPDIVAMYDSWLAKIEKMI